MEEKREKVKEQGLKNMEIDKKVKRLCHWSPRGQKKHEGAYKNTRKIIAENFSNLARIPSKINPNIFMLRHIIIKFLKPKVEENISIAARGKMTPDL